MDNGVKWVKHRLSTPIISLFWLVLTGVVAGVSVVGSLFAFGVFPGLLIILTVATVILAGKYALVLSEGARLQQYMRSLFDAVGYEMVKYDEEVEYIYKISTGDDDWLERKSEIIPITGELPWKRIILGCTGGSDRAISFRDILATAEVSDGDCWLVPIDESENDKLDSVVFFRPAIQIGEKRTLTIRARWKGLWKPLRESGEDAGIVAPAHQGTTLLAVKILLPPGTKNLEWRTFPPEAIRGEGIEEGQPYLRWEITKPSLSTYHYSVKAQLPK